MSKDGYFPDHALVEDKFCFGCGLDWINQWSAKDLAPVTIDGTKYDVCPDCLEEVSEEYSIQF
jgi:hypothetical protein